MGNRFIVDVDAGMVLDRLAALERAGTNMRPHLDKVGSQLVDLVRLTFHESRDPYGRPWKPLKLRDGQPLRNTGLLMNSVTHLVRGNSVEIGTNVPYAPVHQFGARIEPKRARFLVFRDGQGGWIRARKVEVPARPFLPTDGLPDDWERSVLDVLSQSIMRQAGAR